MSYTSYTQIIRDINYGEQFETAYNNRNHRPIYETHEYVDWRTVKKLKTIWKESIIEKFNNICEKSSLGKFLARYPLKFKEFCCLIDLLEDVNEKSDFEREAMITESKDIFKKHKVRFESSMLKRHKLVFKIVNPLRPLKINYEVSYKAQLGLKNKKYIDEYQQLDLALEEESKINSPDQLDSLYYIIEPKNDFDDLIASAELIENLKSAIAREQNKSKIMKNWGFGKILDYGHGTTLNFRGPPGTGKTLAAYCFAKALGRKLLMVRYDQLQNCFVGVTEKHIQMVFRIAKTKNAVLFFDEADAIAVNRAGLEHMYEMSQVNTLLKELERFDGVCIFATNFAEKYDPAFERRLTMHISFKLPDKNDSVKILEKVLPRKAVEKGISFDGLDLAGLSGGDIKNIALNAAGIALREKSEKITRNHIEKSTQMVKQANANPKETNYIS